jgi:mRNA guanylyltransferase
LILDTYEDGTTELNFLCFDALIVEGKLLIERPYNKRLGYLGQNVIEPLKSMLKKHPELRRRHPFGVKIKNMQFGYNIDYILNHEAKQLGHKSDGLIFTSVEAPYALGTCDTMLKWKPPCENSVDFRLNLESQGPALKPKFLLSIWTGGSGYQLSSEMGVTDEEWIRFKRMPNLDNSIVEVVYNPDHCPPHKWKFLRFREDKPHANHISVLEKILKSIDDNIDTERVIILHYIFNLLIFLFLAFE